jgi:hypothetical protein
VSRGKQPLKNLAKFSQGLHAIKGDHLCVSSNMQEAMYQTGPVHIIPTMALASEARAHGGAYKGF